MTEENLKEQENMEAQEEQNNEEQAVNEDSNETPQSEGSSEDQSNEELELGPVTTGKVKFFNPAKGFGFIAGDDGKDYFVHFTGLSEGTKLYPDNKVKFNPVETDKGLQARNVSVDE